MSRRGRRRRPAAGRPVWLFDLDNTLHDASREIFPLINQAMTAYIEQALGVDTDAANRLRHDWTMRHGATLLGLARRPDIDAADFLTRVHAFDALAGLVCAERGLKSMLRALPGRRIILTNGPETYAREVLDALGIAGEFERLIAIEHMRRGRQWRAKPDAAMLRGVLRGAGARAADTILVEDTRSHLKHYRQLGVATVWMTRFLGVRAGGQRIARTGRPHYIDLHVRSLRALGRAAGRLHLAARRRHG
jgi:pyrimidine 5'-nucleotidase